MSFFKPQTQEAVGSKGMLGGTLCTVSLELLRSVNLEIKRRFLISSLECARFFTISAPIKVEDTISVTASLQKSLPYVDTPHRDSFYVADLLEEVQAARGLVVGRDLFPLYAQCALNRSQVT